MSFRMRLNHGNNNNRVLQKNTQTSSQKNNTEKLNKPVINPDGRPIITDKSKQTRNMTPVEKQEKESSPKNYEQFTVGEDTFIYDKESSLWKIK